MDRGINLPMRRPAISAPWSRSLSAGIVLTTFAVALLVFAWLGQPRGFAPDHWYALSMVEGTTTYAAYTSETACRAAEESDHAACVLGADLSP